jgi:hypothetical protein
MNLFRMEKFILADGGELTSCKNAHSEGVCGGSLVLIVSRDKSNPMHLCLHRSLTES